MKIKKFVVSGIELRNIMNKWQSIKNAPRDGTAILSDVGFVKYWNVAWFSDRKHVVPWLEPFCEPNDKYTVQVNPKWWMPVPPVAKE